MASNIIDKLYRQIIIASVAAICLAILFFAVTGCDLAIVATLLAMILVYYAVSYITLRQAAKNGELIVIYGTCIAADAVALANHNRTSAKRSMYRYRFSVPEQTGGDPASVYIVARQSTFALNEKYCLLFRRTDKKGTNDAAGYTERNLLGYDIVASVPVVESVDGSKSQSADDTDTMEKGGH